MKIVELTYRKRGRVVGREASRIENESLTLSGDYPTRQAELEALGYQVERRVRRDWPAFAKAQES
jgi:hypothetical protein